MDFVIVEHDPHRFEVEQRFSFHGGRLGKPWQSNLGTLQGNINDDSFAKKLNRWRARLDLRNVEWSQAVTPVTVKEVKRMNDFERWSRKQSRAFNEFWKRVDAIQGDLFYQEKLLELTEDYKRTVEILKQRYGQGNDNLAFTWGP